jgi:uncharacterized protein
LIEQLARIDPSERILLLPHCLRKSKNCQATYNQQGLQCARCNPECSVNKLTSAANKYGYKGVCVAPGGRLALKFVRENRPQAVVAVACDKELSEGVQGVKELAADNIVPVMIIIPLVKDGCVDTEVDDHEAQNVIRTGCRESANSALEVISEDKIE